MQLDKRQKILVGVLVGLPVLYWGTTTIWEFVFGPFTARYTQLAALDERLGQKQSAKHKLELAERLLMNGDRRSLPSDPSSLAYQVWLTDLAKKHEFESLSVAPKSTSKNGNEPFSRIRFAITAHCHAKTLCHFLYDFYRTDLMHKVTNLSIKSTDTKSDPKLEVTIDVEGLTMQTTKKRDSLFEGKQEQVVAISMSKKEFSDYETFYAPNRFARGYNGPPKAAMPPPPPSAPFDSASYVFFVGGVEYDGVREAWLFDRSANKQTILKPDQDIEIAAIKAKVMTVSNDFVILKIKDKTWRLDLGESLKQIKEVSSDGKTIASPGTPAAPNTPASTTTDTKPASPSPPEATKTDDVSPPSKTNPAPVVPAVTPATSPSQYSP